MNWYKQITANYNDPVTADPEQVGYRPSWGEHHGPVTYTPDRWNFGQRGYYSPPMPLPKKIYHVTPYPDKILQEGFKTFPNPREQTFGGHGTYVSFTTLANAQQYQEGLKDLVRAANGWYSWEDVDALARKWQLDPEKTQSIKNDVERWSATAQRTWTEPEKVAEFLKTSSIYQSKFPLFFGSMRELLPRLAKVEPQDVAIMEASSLPQQWHTGIGMTPPEEMKGKYTYNENETEWRMWDTSALPKENIRRIA